MVIFIIVIGLAALLGGVIGLSHFLFVREELNKLEGGRDE